MKKISFISGIAVSSIFSMNISAKSKDGNNFISQIVDQNVIKQYVQQFQPVVERNDASCKIAASQSNIFLGFQQNQQQEKKITQEEEQCLDNKYLVTQWGQENVVAHCDVKQNREYFSECYLNIKKGNEYIFYAQLILDSRDRKAYFFGEELDINSFNSTNQQVQQRKETIVNYNMKYSITENGNLELHLYQGNTDKFLYTQSFNQIK